MKRFALYIWISLIAIPLVMMWMARMYGYIKHTDEGVSLWLYVLDGWLAVVGIPWLVGILIVLTGYIIGELTVKKIFTGNLVNPILSTAIGLGVIAWFTYLLGLSGAFRWYVILPMGIGVWIWGFRSIYPLISALGDGLRGILSWHWTEKTLLGVIIWYIYRTLPSVTNPATGWDECNSHLVLPKLYVESGGIGFYEWVNFSNFPPFLHMLVSIQRLFTETPGAVWPYLFHLGTLAVIWMLVRDVFTGQWIRITVNQGGVRMWWRLSALLAVLLYLCIPLTTMSSQAVLTDPVLVFYCSLLLWYLHRTFKLLDYSDVDPVRRKMWIVAGLLCGAIISIKYTGIIWVALALFTFLIPWEWKIRQVKPVLRCLLVAVLYCAPWLLRNIILFGDPIFPTLSPFIPLEWGTVPVEIQSQLAVNYHSMLDFFGVWNLTWVHWLGLSDPAPWSGSNPRPDETGPFLLVGVPLIAFVWKDLSRDGKIAVLVGLAYIAVWLLGIGILQTRYWLPAYPVLCAGIAVAITKLLEERNG